MGAFCGKAGPTPQEQAEKERSIQLNKTRARAREQDSRINKLLLLGAGESGKSTLFKQILMIYGTDGKDEKELQAQIPVIKGNVITNAKSLVEAAPQFGPPETDEGKAALEYIENEIDDDTVDNFDFDVVAQLQAFWRDPGIQKCYEQRANYQLNDSTKYFMDMLDKMVEPSWVPSTDDLLRTRVRTTGIVESNFNIDENDFRIFDVGGQRNERKKWIHCFQDVTAVMFVAAISEYDQVLFEDYTQNRMTEALTLFEEIVNSEWFQKTAFILFLNKDDLFREKIKKKNITDSACEELKLFTGDCTDYDQVSSFITGRFVAKKKAAETEDEFGQKPMKIHTHLTCATNTALVKNLFGSVKEIVIGHALREAGLGH